MACEDIRQNLTALRADKRELERWIDDIKGGAGLPAAQAQLASLTSQIATQEQALADCEAVASPPPARPFVARVREIFCNEARREVGKEEPYLVIASIDMLASATVGGLPPLVKPAVRCFLVGPFDDFRKGTRRTINSKPFWDLNSEPRLIASPEDVVFLVGMCENDGSSAHGVRGHANGLIELSILQTMGLDYPNFVDTAASAMTAGIDTAGIGGIDPAHLNADDRIDDVKHLALTTEDLDTIAALGSTEKSLTFTRKNPSGKVNEEYTVTFAFER